VQNHMRPATGRLDRWFRPKIAETIRELLQSQGPDSGPGGEWPHSYGNTPNDDPYFWQVAKSEDYNAPDNDIQSQIKSR